MIRTTVASTVPAMATRQWSIVSDEVVGLRVL